MQGAMLSRSFDKATINASRRLAIAEGIAMGWVPGFWLLVPGSF